MRPILWWWLIRNILGEFRFAHLCQRRNLRRESPLLFSVPDNNRIVSDSRHHANSEATVTNLLPDTVGRSCALMI